MGKVWDLVSHPLELRAALHLKFVRKPLHPRDTSLDAPSLKRCYELLNLTSRSFAAVIQELHPELRDAVMLFYIILRALDTIEDDMTIPEEKKIKHLLAFYTYLETNDWTFTESGPNEKDAVVLVEFDKVLVEYHKLKPEYQAIISDITKRMGAGMADYVVDKDFNKSGIKTIKAFDLYCHHVAGIVGEGLTRLTILAKFATPVLEKNPRLHDSMGLFLQKVNIFRDYREDLDDGRTFWPKEIWGNYAENLSDFIKPEFTQQGLYCISDLLVNALGHAVDCLEYLNNVTDTSVFTFCSIPQVMAIATLELVYQNPKVFQTNIKIRKGQAATLISESETMAGVCRIFREYIRKIHHKSRPEDPNYLRIGIACGKIEQYIEELFPTNDGMMEKSESRLATERVENLVLFGAYATFFAISASLFYGMLCLTGSIFGPNYLNDHSSSARSAIITKTIQTVVTGASSVAHDEL
ncbi:squalene synthetase [Nadsonia fulvescens var. elongata DSM 6958]|uniref:Squalene synthase n=1 Tax=Nadsonia fulvescens var. elongata DSM 6958 TaxID=857566 RepID=A0A1E3PQP9_9ASCO|nr:squalene synthetase [Nadsonia fulvescens var. elongata DSM 6958]